MKAAHNFVPVLGVFNLGLSCLQPEPAQAAAVNGACGSSNGVAMATAPATNTLCSTGAALPVNIGNGGAGPWSWNCAGSGGGSPAFCTTAETPAQQVDSMITKVYRQTLSRVPDSAGMATYAAAYYHGTLNGTSVPANNFPVTADNLNAAYDNMILRVRQARNIKTTSPPTPVSHRRLSAFIATYSIATRTHRVGRLTQNDCWVSGHLP